MQQRDSEEVFVERLKARLGEGERSLDAGIRSRLARARHRALDELGTPARSPARVWLPVGAAAAAAIVAVALWQGRVTDEAMPVAGAETPLDDLDILVAEESLELIADWEFYQWLGGEPDVG